MIIQRKPIDETKQSANDDKAAPILSHILILGFLNIKEVICKVIQIKNKRL
jgi:hypothetical protein